MTDYDALLQVRREKYFYKALAFERFDRITEMEAERDAWRDRCARMLAWFEGKRDDTILADVRAALAPAPAPGDGWRHVKRGTTYDVVGVASLQTEKPLADFAPVVVYRCRETGTLWARAEVEFHDGRFVRLAPALAPAPAPEGE